MKHTLQKLISIVLTIAMFLSVAPISLLCQDGFILFAMAKNADYSLNNIKVLNEENTIKTQSEDDTILKLGESTELFVDVRDQDGNPVTDAPLVWSASPEGVVRIDRDSDTRSVTITVISDTKSEIVTITASIDDQSVSIDIIIDCEYIIVKGILTQYDCLGVTPHAYIDYKQYLILDREEIYLALQENLFKKVLCKVKNGVIISCQNNDFYQYSYIADIWLNQNGRENTWESSFIRDCLIDNTALSTLCAEDLKSDKNFVAAKNAKGLVYWVFDPVSAAKEKISREQLYEAVILTFLEKVQQEKAEEMNKVLGDSIKNIGQASGTADTIYNDYIKSIYDNASDIGDFIEDFSNVKKNSKTFKTKLGENWHSFAKEGVFKDSNSTSDNVLNSIEQILNIATDAYDFFERFIAYTYVYEMSTELQELLWTMEMHSTGEFRDAIISIRNAVDNADKEKWILIADLGTNMTMDLANGFFNVIADAIPGYGKIRKIYKVADSFVNIFLNTDDIIDGYRKVDAVSQFILAMKDSVNFLQNKYINSRTETNAMAYVYSVRCYHYAYEIDLEQFANFYKVCKREGLYNIVVNAAKELPCKLIAQLFGGTFKNSYDQISDSVDSIKYSLNSNFISLDNNWIYQYLKYEDEDIYKLYLREELKKNLYKANVSGHITSNGHTLLFWNIPSCYEGSDGNSYINPAYQELESITTTELVGTHKDMRTYEFFETPRPIDFYYNSGFETFPKKYSLNANANSGAGIVSTEKTDISIENPLKKPSLKPNKITVGFSNNAITSSSFYIDDDTNLSYNVTYQIYRDGELIKTINRDKHFNIGVTDTSAVPGRTYKYKVVSKVKFTNGKTLYSPASEEISIKCGNNGVNINTNTRSIIRRPLSSYSLGDNQVVTNSIEKYGIEISWENVENSGYEIYRLTEGCENYTLIVSLPAGVTTYIDDDVHENIKYTYVVMPYLTDSNNNKIYDNSTYGESEIVYSDETEKEHTVTWNIDGKITKDIYYEGDKILKPSDPTKPGYVFIGWTPTVPESMPNEDMTFIAEFEKLPVYTVTWIVDGTKTINYYYEGDAIVKPVDPIKSGYTFIGWTPTVPNIMPAKNITFNAMFDSIPTTQTIRGVQINDIELKYKSTTNLNPIISADPGTKYTVKYSSSNTKVATVDENGKIYASKRGNTTITCTVIDANGVTVSDSCNVKVKYTFGQWLLIIILFGWIWY